MGIKRNFKKYEKKLKYSLIKKGHFMQPGIVIDIGFIKVKVFSDEFKMIIFNIYFKPKKWFFQSIIFDK